MGFIGKPTAADYERLARQLTDALEGALSELAEVYGSGKAVDKFGNAAAAMAFGREAVDGAIRYFEHFSDLGAYTGWTTSDQREAIRQHWEIRPEIGDKEDEWIFQLTRADDWYESDDELWSHVCARLGIGDTLAAKAMDFLMVNNPTEYFTIHRFNAGLEGKDWAAPEPLEPLPVAIVDESGGAIRVVGLFATVAEAEAWIADAEKREPEKVHRGDYGIDAPEEMVNPPIRESR